MEQKLLLEVIHVRQVILVLFLADSPFTAVTGDKLPAAGEAVDRQAAMVRAALALGVVRGKPERFDLFDRKHRGHDLPAAGAV